MLSQLRAVWDQVDTQGISRAAQAGAKLYEINKSRTEESTRDVSIEFFNDGKYRELVAYLKPKIRKEPNNATVLYWLARAYLELGDKSHSRVLFIKVRTLEPSWDKKYIVPYLSTLE